MAKRMIDTDIWKKKWFRMLSLKMKSVWIYLITMCDHAGLYEVDLDLMGLFIGEDITKDEIMDNLGQQIETIDDDKWFLPKFIKFQYNVSNPNELNPKNRVHKSVIDILNSYNLHDGAIKPHSSPLKKEIRGLGGALEKNQGAKDKDKDTIYNSSKNTNSSKKIKRKVFKIPTENEVKDYCDKRGNQIAPVQFMAHYESKGWMVGKNKMVDWQAAVRTWETNNYQSDVLKINPRVFVEPEHRKTKRDW